MELPLTASRLQNIFGSMTQNLSDNTDQSQSQSQPDILSIIAQKLMQPDQNVDAMRSQVNSMPQRQDYQPSILRRIGAAITGVGYGPKAGSDFLNSPFDKATQDWSNKFGATKALANTDNTTQRNEIAAGLKQESINNATTKNSNIYEVQNKKLENQMDVANNKLKQAYEKMQNDQSNKDNLLAFKQAQFDAIQAKNQLDSARKDAILEETKRKHDADISAANQKIKDAETKLNTKTTTQSMKTKIDKMVIEHPEWASFVTKDPNTGLYNIVPQSKGFWGSSSGPDDKTRAAIQQYLIGDTQAPVNNSTNKPKVLSITPVK